MPLYEYVQCLCKNCLKPIKFLQLSPASQHDREREGDIYRERDIEEKGRSFVMEKEMGEGKERAMR